VTDAEAIKWLRKHGCVVIFHEDRIIAFRPRGLVNLSAAGNSDSPSPMISFPHGSTFGYTEHAGETVAELVEHVRSCWLDNDAGVIDGLADCCEESSPPGVELYVGTSMRERYPGLAEGAEQ